MRAGKLSPDATSIGSRAAVERERRRRGVDGRRSSASRSFKGTALESFLMKDGIDSSSVEGAGTPYAIAKPEDRRAPSRGRRTRAVVGARSVTRTRRLRPRCSWTSSSPPPARIRSRCGRALLKDQSASSRRAESGRREGRLGHTHCRKAAAAESPCTSRSAASWPKSRRSRSRATARSSVDRVVCAVDCGHCGEPGRGSRRRWKAAIGYGLSAALPRADHARSVARCSSRTSRTTSRCASTTCPWSRCTSCPRPRHPAESANQDCRRSRPAVVNAIRSVTGKPIRRLPLGDRVPV